MSAIVSPVAGTMARNRMSNVTVPSVSLPSSFRSPLIFGATFLVVFVRSGVTGTVLMVTFGSPSMYFSSMSLREESRNSISRCFRILARSAFADKNFFAFLSFALQIAYPYFTQGKIPGIQASSVPQILNPRNIA